MLIALVIAVVISGGGREGEGDNWRNNNCVLCWDRQKRPCDSEKGREGNYHNNPKSDTHSLLARR